LVWDSFRHPAKSISMELADRNIKLDLEASDNVEEIIERNQFPNYKDVRDHYKLF